MKLFNFIQPENFSKLVRIREKKKQLWIKKRQARGIPINPKQLEPRKWVPFVIKKKYWYFVNKGLLNASLWVKLRRYCRCTIKHEVNNLYINLAYLQGSVIKEFHSGLYYKNSMRRSTYVIPAILKQVCAYLSKNVYNFKGIILSHKGRSHFNRLGKQMSIIFSARITFFKIHVFMTTAHNGIRLRKKRRK